MSKMSPLMLSLMVSVLYLCVVDGKNVTTVKKANPLIFTGTKWCGDGNIASHYDDLGEHNGTDKCCRGHDHCPNYIPPFKERFGLFNLRPTYMFECSCETKFYNCLIQQNNPVAATIGRMYFNMIRNPCFKLVKQRVCVKKSIFDWFGFGGCKTYGLKQIAKLSWAKLLLRFFPQ